MQKFLGHERFGKKTRAFRERAWTAAGYDQHADFRSLRSEDAREIHTIEHARHFNIGDHDIDGFVPLQLAERFGSGHGLPRREASLVQDVDQCLADKPFIVHDEDSKAAVIVKIAHGP